MRQKTWLILGIGVLATWTPPAVAEEFSHSSGYSFTYPRGWVAVADPGRILNPKLLPQEIQDYLKKNNFGMNQVSMVLLRQTSGDFLENLNVVVKSQEMPVDDDSVKKVLKMLPQQYQSMGASIEELVARKRKFGANPAIEVEYRIKLPGSSKAMRQKQAFIPGGGSTYIVTCTARAESYGHYSQAFDSMLASFKVPTTSEKSSAFPIILAAGAIGGLLCLVMKYQGA